MPRRHHQSICTAQGPPKRESPSADSPARKTDQDKKENNEKVQQSGEKNQRDHKVTLVNRSSPRTNQLRKILLQTATTLAFNEDGSDSIVILGSAT